MPKPPDIFEKVNFIWRYIIDPCDAPMTVYVNTALPALLKLFKAWYMPDLQNILLNILRPGQQGTRSRAGSKYRPGWKHSWKGRDGWLRRFLGWSLDDIIGKYFNGLFGLEDRKVSDGLSSLWFIFGIVERINFWIFVANITTDFFYDWFSGIHKLKYCESQPLSVLCRAGPGYRMAVIIGWSALLPTVTLKQRGALFEITGVVQSGVQGAIVVMANYTALNDRDDPAVIGVRITCISGPDAGKVVQAVAPVPVGAQSQVAISGEFRSPCIVWCEDACNGANVLQTENNISAFEVVDFEPSEEK